MTKETVRTVVFVALSATVVVGCDGNPVDPNPVPSRYGQPETRVGIPQIFSFEMISINPPPGSTIRQNGPLTIHPKLKARFFLTKKFVPSWVSLVFIHEDGSDGQVWGPYGDAYEELEVKEIESGAYVQYVSPGDFGHFAKGHTLNASFLVTERYASYSQSCASDLTKRCLIEGRIKYREFVRLDYRFEE